MSNFLCKKTKDISGELEKNLATKELWFRMVDNVLKDTRCACGIINAYKVRALRTDKVVMINDDGNMIEEWANTLRCSCMNCGKIIFIDVDD